MSSHAAFVPPGARRLCSRPAVLPTSSFSRRAASTIPACSSPHGGVPRQRARVGPYRSVAAAVPAYAEHPSGPRGDDPAFTHDTSRDRRRGEPEMTADASRWADNKVAVVTGGNRGLGLEACRQLARAGARVVLASRAPEKGENAAAALRGEGLDVTPHPLDVTDTTSIERLARFVARQFGRLDILVNNAGVFEDSGARGTGALGSDPAIVRRTFETNTLGPLMVSQALVPLMQGSGRVVNV